MICRSTRFHVGELFNGYIVFLWRMGGLNSVDLFSRMMDYVLW